ncbi:hypothetical protein IFM89_020940 [Coptis chinensis]|uniref:At1g61320/AtMIF1 LRR domain-containing protein n=1 Tax=Coptis chinensis TaxID=261450 RepID=A0A835M085_9MAGN|nr:hypothetical protein IFM89_020940 [Coptis chinensis]
MRDSIFNEPAEDLPQLKNLKQVLFVNKVRPIPANLTRFCHLIKLDLMVFLVSHFNLLSVAFILNAAPQLQKFHLALQRVVHYGKVTWEYTEQLYPQLKEVEISGFRHRCNSLGLAIYLLKNAVGL